MSARNPANVPLATDPRWRIASLDDSSESQRLFLDDLLCREEIEPSALYGDGYESLQALSKWAVHWGIEYLQAAGMARAMQEADRAAADATEQAMKAWIAGYYRARQRG